MIYALVGEVVRVGKGVDVYALVGDAVMVGEPVDVYAMVGIRPRSGYRRSEERRSGKRRSALKIQLKFFLYFY